MAKKKLIKKSQSGSKLKKSTGLIVKGYAGDGTALIAFSLDKKYISGLAGFAIKRTDPTGKSEYLPNRLNFTDLVTSDTTAESRIWTPSNEAPFQKFRWIDVPGENNPGEYKYDVTAMYFNKEGKLTEGGSNSISLNIAPKFSPDFEFGFTRGYLSSQAYVRRFRSNPDIRPAGPKVLKYDTSSFTQKYEWLGYHARKMIFDFLDECLRNPDITVDLFAYDLDEPDVISSLQKLGKRLRAFLDDAQLHTKKGALEIEAHKLLMKSAGSANVKQGHFYRFAHDKVMIMKRNGKPVKVITGSANYSVRGLYVQANNVLVFKDEQIAELYEEAFEQSFNDESQFRNSEIAEGWFDLDDKNLPGCSVAFSPHESGAVSLSKVSEAIKNAKSSVLFAVMELSGGGSVMQQLKDLPSHKGLFSYGMTQAKTGLKVYKPGEANGIIVPFSYLNKQVPKPFDKEFSGGSGIVIHHKFIVIDFNSKNSIVFTGSSNLAEGGEKNNGDNLLAIYDPKVANSYAIEAVRLVDHYHFRAAMKEAKTTRPLVLESSKKNQQWWLPYYDIKNIKYRDRILFTG
jgi:phosphatidylserine/phosphatidylglycerophosphate/cardiolipin synthase-like enzyme